MWHQDSFVIWPSASWASFRSDTLWKPSILILLNHSEIASSLLTSDLKMYLACSQLLLNIFWINWLPRWFSSKESACQSWRHRRCRFSPWVRKIPWRRKWQPSAVFLPGESHGQRILAGYRPWDQKESNTTEWLTLPHSRYQGWRYRFSCCSRKLHQGFYKSQHYHSYLILEVHRAHLLILSARTLSRFI